MTATERWIKDAGVVIGGTHLTLADALLDKTSWQAVGKTRGWDFQYSCSNPEHINPKAICPDCEFEQEDTWKEYWLEFINHLADGLTTEEALAKLTT